MARVIIHDENGDREVALSGDHISVGRVPGDNDIVLSNPETSGSHCRFSADGNSWFIEDLNSSNGTRVNGRKVGRFELADGDEIQIGTTTIRFLDSDAVAAADDADLDLELDLEISLEEEAWLYFPEKDGLIEPLTGRTTLGRVSTNTIQLDGVGVSSQHAEIVNENGDWIFHDQGSTNGSQIDGVSVTECPLRHGAHIKIGVEKIIFGLGEQSLAASFGAYSDDDVEAEMGDAVFQLSEENKGKGQGLAFVVWLLVFAGIGVGGWYFIQSEGKRGGAGSQGPKQTAGNLILNGSSFELQEDADETIESASDSLEFEETTSRAASGQYSLLVKAVGGAGEHSIEFIQTIDHVSSTDRLRMGGQFRTTGFSGCIGLMLTFWDDQGEAIGSACINAPEGLSKFSLVEGVFKPPFGTSRARLSISTHGGNGKAYVDDVFVTRVGSANRRDLKVADYDVDVSESGLLTISQDGSELLYDVGLYRMGRRGPETLHEYFIAAELERTETLTHCAGRITDTADGEGMGFDVKIETNANGLDLAVGVDALPKGVLLGLGVSPGVPVTAVSGDNVVRLSESFDIKDVSSLIVGVDIRAARLSFGEPIRIQRTAKTAGVISLHGSAAPLTTQTWKMAVQLDFKSEQAEALALFERAEQARNRKQSLGKAMRLFDEITNRFPYYSDLVKRSSDYSSALRKQGWTLATALEADARDIIFFGTYSINGDDFIAKASKGASLWEGTTFGERVAKVLSRVRAEKQKLLGARALALARNHLMRGKDLMASGRERPVLAKGFFNSVLLLAPGSAEASEAAQQLKRIAALEGEGS